MATVDTTFRFNRFNSLRLESGEESWSQKFEVEYYSTLTVQSQVLCLDGAASGVFILRWLDEDGKKVIDSTNAFSIDNRWKRKTATFEVPDGAVECMFALKNADATKSINVACAMVEAGEIASAFDPSLASQLAYMDANGFYGATVTAWQVVAGILQSVDGKAYFDLEKPEIVMQGKDATWKASPDNPLRLEDGEGEFIGGLVRLPDGRMAVITSVLGSAEDLDGGFAYIGKAEETRGAGIHFEREGHSFSLRDGLYGLKAGGFAIYIDGLRRAEWFETGAFTIYGLEGGQGRLQLFASGSTYIRDAEGQNRLQIFDDGVMSVKDGSGKDRLQLAQDGQVYISDTINVRYWQDSSGTFIQSPDLRNAIGADNTGPYYIKNNVKTYF